MTSGDPDRLAGLHAEAFDAPWDVAAFASLLASPGVFVLAEDDGLILCRVAADEAEILTLAVRPSARRCGLGARLTRDAAAMSAALGASRMFLEVAEDNPAARALYGHLGFRPQGRRRAYYPRPDGPAVDALVLALDLPSALPTDR